MNMIQKRDMFLPKYWLAKILSWKMWAISVDRRHYPKLSSSLLTEQKCLPNNKKTMTWFDNLTSWNQSAKLMKHPVIASQFLETRVIYYYSTVLVSVDSVFFVEIKKDWPKKNISKRIHFLTTKDSWQTKKNSTIIGYSLLRVLAIPCATEIIYYLFTSSTITQP